jgi:hypothetical protein
MVEGTCSFEDGITSSDILSLQSFVNNCQLAERLEVVMQKPFHANVMLLRACLFFESSLNQNISLREILYH